MSPFFPLTYITHRKGRGGRKGVFNQSMRLIWAIPLPPMLAERCPALLVDLEALPSVTSHLERPAQEPASQEPSLCDCCPRHVSISGSANMCKYFIKIEKKKAHEVKAAPL